MTNKPKTISKILLPYAGIMLALCVFAQIITASRGSEIDLISGLALVPAYFYYMYFYFTSKKLLSKVRFGSLVAHFIAFLIVNLSYHVHASILILNDISETNGPAVNLSEGWFGVLFAMFVIWGIGLLIHLIASISFNGYEELDV